MQDASQHGKLNRKINLPIERMKIKCHVYYESQNLSIKDNFVF